MAVAPAFDEARRMQPHEACVAEKLDACLLERGIERGVEGFAIGKIFVVDGERWNEGCFRAQEPLRLRHIGNDRARSPPDSRGFLQALIRACRFDPRPEMRTPTRFLVMG